MSNPTPQVESKHQLLIDKIVFNNFKSFAGEVVIENINPYFNSIVGPNGSGKSNILDGLLFVFGKRTKQIRLNKLSELIFSSSGTKGRIDSASVQIHFKETSSTSLQQFSNFVISREAYFNNTSKYFIDSKAVKFGDVYEFLLTKGLDIKNNRFIILQGEIDSISMMKPKAVKEADVGLLEYLEEIIGSNKHIEPLAALEKELEKVNTEKGEKTRRLKLVEKDIKSLEKQKNEALHLVELRYKISSLKSKLTKSEISKINEEINLIEAEKQEIVNKTKEGSEEISRTEKSLKETQTKLISHKKDLHLTKLEESNLSKKLSKLEKQDLALQEKAKYHKKRYEEIKKEISKKESTTKTEEDSVNTYKKELETLQNSQKSLKSKNEKLKIQFDKLTLKVKDKTEKIKIKLQNKKKECSPFMDKIETLKASQKGLNVKNTISSNNVADSSNNLKSLELKEKEIINTIENSKSSLTTKYIEITELNKLKEEKTSDLSSKKNELTRLQLRKKQIFDKVQNYSLKLKSESNRSRIEQAIIKLARHKKGIFGKLGRLCSINKKYDIAISSSSNVFNYFLVDTTDTATYCIEYLRKNKIGSATFLALDKQNHLFARMNKPFDTPPGSRRLFDCLNINNENFKTAFYYAVKDTLVVDDIGKATSLSYDKNRRRRVVTLKGEVIDVSGTITGGGGKNSYKKGLVNLEDENKGNKKAKNEMGDNVSAVELEGLKGDLEAVSDKVNVLIVEINDLQGLLMKLENKLKESHFQNKKIEAELNELKRQLKIVKSNTDKEEEDLKNYKKEKSNTDKEIEDISNKISNLENENKNGIEELAKIEKELENAYGVEYCNTRDDLANVEESLNNCLDRINKLEGLLSISPEKLESLKKNLESLNKDKEEIISKGKEIKKEQNEIEEKAISLSQQSNTLEKQISNLNSFIKLEQNKETEFKEKIEKLKNKDKHLFDQINKLEENCKSLLKQVKEKESEEKRFIKVKENITKFIEEIVTEENDKLFLQEKSSENEGEEDLNILEETLKKYSGASNEENIKDYYNRKKDVDARQGELNNILEIYKGKKEERDGLLKTRFNEFMSGFNVIASRTKHIYRVLTLGGDAELELVDNLDPFAEGISYSVRPPNKSWKTIQNLSGGEKTLSSLSLVFALHHFKPAPLYIMDEIDAALDFKNVSIVANFIKNTSSSAQFIVVSLRNNLFELANRLIGIYKTYNRTKTISIETMQEKKCEVKKSQDNKKE